MTFNFKSLVLGGVAAIALLSAPLAMLSSAEPGDGSRRGARFEQLNLTDAQTAQIESIREDARNQMRSVLSAEQQATFDAARQEGRRARRELDLSDAQREQIRSIREASKEEINAVLTADQREQLEQMREQRSERRGNRRGERSATR